MKVCPACMRQNDDAAAFCSGCGRNFEQATAAPPPLGTQEISTMAVVSLIFGLLFFIFPAAVVAVILGHISSSQIRKSARRLKGRGNVAGWHDSRLRGNRRPSRHSDYRRDYDSQFAESQNGRERSHRRVQFAHHRNRRRSTTRRSTTNFLQASQRSARRLSGKVPDADGAALSARCWCAVRRTAITFNIIRSVLTTTGSSTASTPTPNPINPGATGSRHFHMDESFELRANSSGPAGRDSPALE